MWTESLSTLQTQYDRALHRELREPAVGGVPLIQESDLAPLPEPVQGFIRRCGFVGQPHTLNAQIVWKEMRLRQAPDAHWLSLQCEQFNGLNEPTRLALMKGRLLPGVAFEGLDTYEHRHGHMRIRLLKLLSVGHSQGRYMDESALVTLLSELMFLPSLAMQKYVLWEPVDSRCARAQLVYGGVDVRGTFHFNADNELVRFDTDDRWREGRQPARVRWSAEVHRYAQGETTRFPHEISATWHDKGGDFVYVCGTVAAVYFNLTRNAPADAPT